MRATLEFNLPEDHHEHAVAVAASALLASLAQLDEYLRCESKYVEPDKQATPEGVRTRLREILDENGVAWLVG